MKLPKLELPSFDGNPLAWREFWDAFISAIHDNLSLPAIQKHQYLRSKLKGDASSLLSGLPVNAENYEVAVRLLRERFGNKQKEIDAHYVALMDLTPAKKRNSQTKSYL